MWIALIGAFLTAAYTVRATYLTFFGEPRGAAAYGTASSRGRSARRGALSARPAPRRPAGRRAGDRARRVRASAHAGAVAVVDHDAHDAHGDGTAVTTSIARPHESPKLILIPICILAFCSIFAGFTQRRRLRRGVGAVQGVRRAAARGQRPFVGAGRPPRQGRQTAPAESRGRRGGEQPNTRPAADSSRRRKARPASSRPSPTPSSRGPRPCSRWPCVGAGLVSSWFVCVALYTETRSPPRRAHRAIPPRPRRLPVPGEQVLPRRPLREGHRPRHRPPDRERRRTGSTSTSSTASSTPPDGPGGSSVGWAYRNVDQRVVDGAVNASGTVANSTGSALRPVQSGKVNQYGALLFGAAAVAAIVLVIVNV